MKKPIFAALFAALTAALSAAPLRMATEAFATSAAQEAAQTAQERAVADAKANTTAATNALSAALSAAIPTDNAQLTNGAGYVTKAVTNGLLKTETDPTVPAWAKAASAPLPPNYATVSNRAMTALQSFTETDPNVPEWAKAESAPMPGNYATVSNKAMTALQSYTETDPAFSAWADAHLVNDGTMVDWARDAVYAQYLGDAAAPVQYSADDITAISNGFAAADESLSSRLSLASLAATNYTDAAIGAAIANTNPTFSNAVLAVGLNIDTNTVAAINALVEAGDELPIGGATSVGALLLALAAAVAALKKRLPYALVVKEIENGAVTLDDRASNTVEISATLSPNTLTVNFPTATSGKVRDFAMRMNIAAGVTAPEIAWPQGVTLENDGGEVPEIADGGTGGSSTILYFSETENNGTTAKFLVKGETLTAITQA